MSCEITAANCGHRRSIQSWDITRELTELFRRPNYGTLDFDVAIDHPKTYTKPWTVRVNQRIMLDNELMEFSCLENQKFLWFLKGQ